jgi:two-component system nitrogen regulation sensor histidine kinase NtrY
LKEIDLDQLRKAVEANGVRRVSEQIPQGEISRTIGRIPFDAEVADARGFVVLSFLIPHSLSEDLESISRGFEEYKQIKLLKEPIQLTYYITISIVALLVVFCAIWFGFYLAKTIAIPIMDLAEGTRRVAEGDLGFTLHRAGDDEIGVLVDSFNRMTRDLRSSREQLELSARMLKEQNLEIEDRRRYMEIVLKNVSAGVITLDREGHVATINPAAERMLAMPADEIVGRSYRALLQGQHLDLAREVRDYLTLSRDDSVEFPLRMTVDGSPRSFRINISVLKDDTERDMGMVMVVDDLTELEKAQRMAAWREVARRIAHEVKNPLTPIKLSAQRLHRKYAERLREPVFEECTRMIIDHVDLIRNLVNEFSAFARFPTANPSPCDLPAIVDETLALFRESHPEIDFKSRLPRDLPPLNLDRQQMKQALINLVSNAIGAIREAGTVTVSVSTGNGDRSVRIEVADDGPGIPDEGKRRLFEPYFSTKKSGMGLGLTIVSTIVADHHGTISVADNQPRGAKFIIDLPGE